ncbi:MAG TPA: RNA polymerase sigma factor [Nitriliruptorales bacterium]
MTLPPFGALVDEHRDRLARFCVAAVGPTDASDLEHDTWLAALRAYPTVVSDQNLGGWLVTIAHRKAIDRWRTGHRETATDQVPDVPAAAVDVVDDGLWAVVDRLPDGARSAVLLRYVADLPYADIGTELGCSEAAARQRVRAGLSTLRTTITREQP